MDPVSSNYFSRETAAKAPQKNTPRFNETVTGIVIPRLPPHYWYTREDYIQFKNEIKTKSKDSVEDENPTGTDANRSEDMTLLKIFSHALNYLSQFFGSIPNPSSTDLEEELSAPRLPHPRKKVTFQHLEKKPWMVVQPPFDFAEVDGCIFVLKTSITAIPEDTLISEAASVDDNTATNTVVTQATTVIRNRLKKRKDLKLLEKNLEPT